MNFVQEAAWRAERAGTSTHGMAPVSPSVVAEVARVAGQHEVSLAARASERLAAAFRSRAAALAPPVDVAAQRAQVELLVGLVLDHLVAAAPAFLDRPMFEVEGAISNLWDACAGRTRVSSRYPVALTVHI